jgi:putative FmdB family regulatory protein
MALYGFACGRCGPFELRRPMSEAAAPACCPACGDEARRIFTPPGLALLAAPLRGALDGEERSAHEPDVVTSKRGRPLSHGRHAPAPPWVLSH